MYNNKAYSEGASNLGVRKNKMNWISLP